MTNETVIFDLFKLGATVFSDGDSIEISREFARNIIANFQRLQREGQVVPVLVEHNRNGRSVGEVVDVFLNDGFIQGRLLLKTEEIRNAWNNGEIDFDSPGFVLQHEHPHTGEQLSETLFEVSITSLPRQINLRPATQINPGVVLAYRYDGQLLTGEHMSTDTQELSDQTLLTDMQGPDDEEEAFSLSDEDVDRIATRLASLMNTNQLSEGDEDEDDDAVGLSADDDQVAHLAHRVDQLEAENTRLELSAAGITDAADVALLSSVKRTNPTAYEPLIAKLSKKSKRGPQSPIGYGGTPPAGGASLVARVNQALAQAGIEDAKEQIKFIDEKFGRDNRRQYMLSK